MGLWRSNNNKISCKRNISISGSNDGSKIDINMSINNRNINICGNNNISSILNIIGITHSLLLTSFSLHLSLTIPNNNDNNNWLQRPLESIIRMVRLFPLGVCCGPGLYGNGTCPKPSVGRIHLIQPPVRYVQVYDTFSDSSIDESR